MGRNLEGAIMAEPITLEDHGSRGRYVLRKDGLEAELTFSRKEDGTIRIKHTGVPEPLGGQGIAARLVARAVEDARAAGVKIDPVCSYAAAQFAKHPEWADLRKS
jgi:predicted GNAT family acetyltransferase